MECFHHHSQKGGSRDIGVKRFNPALSLTPREGGHSIKRHYLPFVPCKSWLSRIFLLIADPGLDLDREIEYNQSSTQLALVKFPLSLPGFTTAFACGRSFLLMQRKNNVLSKNKTKSVSRLSRSHRGQCESEVVLLSFFKKETWDIFVISYGIFCTNSWHVKVYCIVQVKR